MKIFELLESASAGATGSGAVASVVNPGGKPKSQVGSLFGGTYGEKESMMPKSAFAGSNKNKLGPAAHLKGKMKRPARAGDLVGGSAESYEPKVIKRQ